MSRIDTFLEQLNPPQKEAVLENERPLLVLAGAGSGKTRVITTKIAYAIDSLNLNPSNILAVTFTNKAASEMRTRVASMLTDVDVSSMQIRTFHSFGAWLLRRYGSAIGLKDNFSIYDDDDSLSLLASCYPEYKRTELNPVAKAISLAKDIGITVEDPRINDFSKIQNFQRMFTTYQKRLRSVGNVDFADLIGLSIELLRSSKSVLNRIHRQYAMILVDEYQDSNIAQFELMKLLVGPESFICVVGDDDQSIYRFRGAEVRNILSFPDVFAHTRTIKLEQNYRSTANILAIAQAVIANNSMRHPKTLWTANDKGIPGRLVYVDDGKEEARKCAELINQNRDYDNCAILYRTNAQSAEFETLFARLGIPYKVVGALRFFDREEVKDTLALLYLLMNRNDQVHFTRMVNKPTRGIGDTSLQKILDTAAEQQIGLTDACKVASERNLLSAKASMAAAQFALMFEKAEELLEQSGNSACVEYLVTASGLLDHYKKADDQNRTSKAENIGALISAVNDYPDGTEGMLAFLESLSLDPTRIGNEDPSDKPGVTLITMHNTKGLEFDRVFITGLEEGLFPSRSCETDEDLQEERRIFYVAITRARKELYMFSCRQRLLWGKTNWQMPSRFLKEIPKNLIVTDGLERPRFGYDSYSGMGALEERRIRQGFRNQNIIRHTPKFDERSKQVATEKISRSFKLGDRVYHEQYGEGEVRQVRALKDRTIVDVAFATGKKATFFADAPMLEKLGSG
ncbi:MAG: UvrD-helicase domain-containing protein [Spirochaetales bacterium]|nr:UvrD-helicase domain-containing protein [Spirochaetales bacterium]